MNILIDIAHPAHVHLIRRTYDELIKKGHTIYVTVKEIPSAIVLLEKFNIPYIQIGKTKDSIRAKAFFQIIYNLKVWWLVIRKNIKIGFGSSLTIAQISRISALQSIVLDDDDDLIEPLFVKFAHNYANVILTPDVVNRKSSNKICYQGYHELAYLHPNYFTPNENVLKEIGIKKGESYFILRFNAFKAHHDVGAEGLSFENKKRLISLLEKRGKVFITSERNIDNEFKKYQLLLAPEKIHSLIYFATMLIGDSQTMTSEAAILGTPAIKCNTFAGKLSVPNELENKYHLCFSFTPEQSEDFFNKINELLENPKLKVEFKNERDKLLNDKIDVSAFFVWFIENYPESAKIMKEDPDYQYKFK